MFFVEKIEIVSARPLKPAREPHALPNPPHPWFSSKNLRKSAYFFENFRELCSPIPGEESEGLFRGINIKHRIGNPCLPRLPPKTLGAASAKVGGRLPLA